MQTAAYKTAQNRTLRVKDARGLGREEIQVICRQSTDFDSPPDFLQISADRSPISHRYGMD
jgi:hypothetical protein